MVEKAESDEGGPMLNSLPPIPRDGVPLARPVILLPAIPSPSERARGEFLLLAAARGNVWWDICAVIIFVVVFDLAASFAASFAAGLIGWPADQSEAALRHALFLPLVVSRTVIVIAGVAVVLRRRGESAHSIGLAMPGFTTDVMLGISGMIVSYLLISLWLTILLLYWRSLWDQMAENAERIMTVVPKLHPLAFAPVSLAVGVYEEVFFRGFLMTRLRRGTGSWVVAVLVSTVLFTYLHSLDQTTAAVVAVTILSLVFSVITIWRRSIVPAIVGHFLFDWSQFLSLSFQAGEAWT